MAIKVAEYQTARPLPQEGIKIGYANLAMPSWQTAL